MRGADTTDQMRMGSNDTIVQGQDKNATKLAITTQFGSFLPKHVLV